MKMTRTALLVIAALLLSACAGDAGGEPGDAAETTVSEAVADHGADRLAGSRLNTTLIPDPEETGFQGAVLDLPVPKPDFTLTATDGSEYDFIAETSDAAVTMLYIGYTTCPDICPSHMAALAAALRSVEPEIAEQVEVVFVSVDTVNDTPAQVREYLDSFDESFVGLTGDVEEVNAVLTDMGLAPTAIDDMADFPPAHPINVVAFTGDEARIAYPFGIHGGAIAEDLPTLVNEGVVL